MSYYNTTLSMEKSNRQNEEEFNNIIVKLVHMCTYFYLKPKNKQYTFLSS